MRNADSGNKSAIHWAWIILAVCFVNLFVNYGIRLGYGVVIPEMIRTLGLSRRQAGDIFDAYFLAYICLSLFVGNLTDRLGARKVIPLFGIILGIGAILAHRLAGHIRDATGSFAIAIMASIIAAVLVGSVKQPVQENEY